MQPYTLYFWISVWLLIVPFSGIPDSWKVTLMKLTALCFLAYALFLMRQSRLNKTGDAGESTPTEHVDQEKGIPNV